MNEDLKIARAEARVDAARDRLVDTLGELQQRLSPRTLAHDAWESAKVKTADLAEDAVDAVKSRPVAAGSALAAVAMFLAREPLMDLAGQALGKASAKRKEKNARKRASKAQGAGAKNTGKKARGAKASPAKAKENSE